MPSPKGSLEITNGIMRQDSEARQKVMRLEGSQKQTFQVNFCYHLKSEYDLHFWIMRVSDDFKCKDRL